MKFSTVFTSLLLIPLFCVTLVQGQTYDGPDSVMIIPRSGTAPTIDAVFDNNVYHNATKGYVRINDVSMTPPDDWYDNFGTFYTVWNGNFLFIYIAVMDDIIDQNTSGNAYENDSIELYFDGDNSKGATYDGTDDVQWRFGSTSNEWDFDYNDVDFDGAAFDYPDMVEFMFAETDIGYDLEVMVPIAELNIITDADFGFEIQMNENDTGGRDGMLRWWGNTNESWQNASVFGTARLSDRLVSDVLDVNEISSAPTIDGEIDAAWWNLPVFGQGTFVTLEQGEPMESYMETDDWYDLLMQYRVGYDDDAMYLLVEVTDDVPGQIVANAWESDGIEIYVDANYSQEGAMNENENYQWRWVYGEATGGLANGEAAWYDTYWGYNIEIKLPWADMPFSPVEGQPFGWDIQINDSDGGDQAREHMARWWSNDNNEYLDFSLCGTAQIGVLDDVKPLASDGIITRFELAQNYPNPFNPVTQITYSVPRNDQVRLCVYDVLGREVATLVNEVQTAGTYTATFDGSNLSSGIYLYRLESGGTVLTNKMMLVK